MVAKFMDDNKLKTSPFQSPLVLFNFTEFVKCWRNILGSNPKARYPSLEKEEENGVMFAML